MNGNRKAMCVEEHLASSDPVIGCNLMRRDKFVLPEGYQQYPLTRTVLAKKDEKKEGRTRGSEKKRATTVALDVTPSPTKRSRRA